MREPIIFDEDSGTHTPLSAATVDELRRVGSIRPTPGGETSDMDFVKRYAAILLRERGL